MVMRPVPDRDFSIVEMLKSAGLRPTRQRRALARLLFGQGNRHVTAEQLHGEAMADSVHVSLATVYNTLHQFTEAGLLRELVVEAGRCYFDTNVRHHHHFYDETSAQLMDIPDDSMEILSLPQPPADAEIAQVDVIVRLRSKDL